MWVRNGLLQALGTARDRRGRHNLAVRIPSDSDPAPYQDTQHGKQRNSLTCSQPEAGLNPLPSYCRRAPGSYAVNSLFRPRNFSSRYEWADGTAAVDPRAVFESHAIGYFL